MKFILGLDPGIASIGWALIQEAENADEESRIIASNVVKVDFDNFTFINDISSFSLGIREAPSFKTDRTFRFHWAMIGKAYVESGRCSSLPTIRFNALISGMSDN